MIRIAVLVTLLASQTLAKFKYNEICGVDCINSWRACMITQISKDEFNPACLESKEFKSFEEDLNPLSACIDFVDDVKGNRDVLTAYQEYLQRRNPVTASTTIARSSTADSVVTVVSELATSPPAPASSPSSTPRLPPAPTPTEMLPTILPPNEPALQGDGEASSEIMLAGVGLAAMVLLAICFHLCCRTTKKRSSINEEPLKLNSDDFSGVESEKHVKPDAEENAKWKAYNSSYL